MKAVTEPNAATVVRTIVAMSHHLGIKVIAEGSRNPGTPPVSRGTPGVRRRPRATTSRVPSPPLDLAAAVDSIHRMFDERKLLDQLRIAPSQSDTDRYEADRKLDEQSSAFQLYPAKQVVM